jgi:hypothetical protein
MPSSEDACRQAVYAFDVLHADGVGLLGSTDGKFLSGPRFNELMAELVVFLQPNPHPTTE